MKTFHKPFGVAKLKCKKKMVQLEGNSSFLNSEARKNKLSECFKILFLIQSV